MTNQKIFSTLILSISLSFINFSFAQNNVNFQSENNEGSSVTTTEKSIMDNAINSYEHTTLVNALNVAGLSETLKNEGPFTVFAPTNEAFDKLPKGTLKTFLKPENKSILRSILIYHVVSGVYSAADILATIKKDGKATLKTINGGVLVFTIKENIVCVTDENAIVGKVYLNTQKQTNGIFHNVDTLLNPR